MLATIARPFYKRHCDERQIYILYSKKSPSRHAGYGRLLSNEPLVGIISNAQLFLKNTLGNFPSLQTFGPATSTSSQQDFWHPTSIALILYPHVYTQRNQKIALFQLIFGPGKPSQCLFVTREAREFFFF